MRWAHGACPNHGDMNLTRKQVTDLMLEYYEKYKDKVDTIDDEREAKEAEAEGLRW